MNEKAKAMAAIEVALAVSSAHDLGALARYLYIRAKILQVRFCLCV